MDTLRVELSQAMPASTGAALAAFQQELPSNLSGAPPEVIAMVREVVFLIVSNLDDENEQLIHLLVRHGCPGGRSCRDAQDRLWAAETLFEHYTEQWFAAVM